MSEALTGPAAWLGGVKAHLGQVLEEFPKFEDNEEDEKGRYGSSNLQGRGKHGVKVSNGGPALADTACIAR